MVAVVGVGADGGFGGRRWGGGGLGGEAVAKTLAASFIDWWCSKNMQYVQGKLSSRNNKNLLEAVKKEAKWPKKPKN